MDNSTAQAQDAPKARILLFTTWADDGNWYFLNSLRKLGHQVDLMEPLFIRSRWVPGFVKRLSVRLCSTYQPFLAMLKASRYDAVASWNTRVGTVYGICARFLPKNKRPVHILRDFHLDFTRFADPVYQVRLLLVRAAVPGVDAFLATSREEARLYAEMFSICPEKILFYPDTPGGVYMTPRAYPEGDYVFAYGNSDRDFDTFFAAAKRFGLRAVALSQAYAPSEPLPANAEMITRRVPQPELMELIGRARVVVIPTKSYYVAAGQNAMLEVMCLSRPLVVTKNITTVEHAADGQNALFFPARDASALAEAVNRLLEDPGLAGDIGQNARQAAMACPQMQVDIFLEVLGRLLRKEPPAGGKA